MSSHKFDQRKCASVRMITIYVHNRVLYHEHTVMVLNNAKYTLPIAYEKNVHRTYKCVSLYKKHLLKANNFEVSVFSCIWLTTNEGILDVRNSLTKSHRVSFSSL